MSELRGTVILVIAALYLRFCAPRSVVRTLPSSLCVRKSVTSPSVSACSLLSSRRVFFVAAKDTVGEDLCAVPTRLSLYMV